MKHQDLLKRAIDITNLVQGLVSTDLVCCVGNSGINSSYLFLHNTRLSQSEFGVCQYTDNEILKAGIRLCKVEWLPVNNICSIDIGKTVYVDKVTPIVIKSISVSEEGTVIIADNLITYSAKRLWIKDV